MAHSQRSDISASHRPTLCPIPSLRGVGPTGRRLPYALPTTFSTSLPSWLVPQLAPRNTQLTTRTSQLDPRNPYPHLATRNSQLDPRNPYPHLATRNSQPATRNSQPATRNPQHAPRTPQLATRNPHPATHNPQPATRNP
jgi:hypothetical protein